MFFILNMMVLFTTGFVVGYFADNLVAIVLIQVLCGLANFLGFKEAMDRYKHNG